MWEKLKLTFLDKDGSFAIPELSATGTAIGAAISFCMMLAGFITEVWVRHHTPDYINFASGVAALCGGAGGIVVALGLAQRIRDGLWKDTKHD